MLTSLTLSRQQINGVDYNINVEFSGKIDYFVAIYPVAGNFRGVLIFVIFVVDLAVTKFSHPLKLMPGVILWYYASP